jgi:hypothetical protein
MVKPSCRVDHDWGGCICRGCGQLRDIDHDWEGCMCKRCRQARDEQHDWDGSTCRRCGKMRCPTCQSTSFLYDDQLSEHIKQCGDDSK